MSPLLYVFLNLFLISKIISLPMDVDILKQIEDELNVEYVTDDNVDITELQGLLKSFEVKEEVGPTIDYSKYNITGLKADGYFNGEKVKSITEMEEDLIPSKGKKMTSKTAIKSTTPVKSVKPIKSAQEILNVEPVESITEVKSITPVDKEVVEKLMNILQEERDSKLKSSPTPSEVESAKSPAIEQLKEEPAPGKNMDPDLTKILDLLGIKSLSQITKVTPLDNDKLEQMSELESGVRTIQEVKSGRIDTGSGSESKQNKNEDPIVKELNKKLEVLENKVKSKENDIKKYIEMEDQLDTKIKNLVEMKEKSKIIEIEKIKSLEEVKNIVEVAKKAKVNKIEEIISTQEVKQMTPIKNTEEVVNMQKIKKVTPIKQKMELTQEQVKMLLSMQAEYDKKKQSI